MFEALAGHAGVLQAALKERPRQAAQLLLPRSRTGLRQLDLWGGHLDRGVHQVILAREVAIQGHRAHPEFLGQPAHRERLCSVSIHDRERTAGELLASKTGLGSRSASLLHAPASFSDQLTNCVWRT